MYLQHLLGHRYYSPGQGKEQEQQEQQEDEVWEVDRGVTALHLLHTDLTDHDLLRSRIYRRKPPEPVSRDSRHQVLEKSPTSEESSNSEESSTSEEFSTDGGLTASPAMPVTTKHLSPLAKERRVSPSLTTLVLSLASPRCLPLACPG